MNETRGKEDTETPPPPVPRDDAGLYVGATAPRLTTALRRLALAIVAVCAVMLAWAPPAAHARSVNWTGQGSDDNWTTDANWQGSVAPAAGDDLVFPNFSFRKKPINNFPVGTVWHSIEFQGSNFEISGNPIIVQLKIAAIDTSGGTNRIAQQVSSVNGMTLDVRSGNKLILQGGVDMNGLNTPNIANSVVVQDGGEVELGPLVAATSNAELHKSGNGTTRLLTDNPNFNARVVITTGNLILTTPGGLGTAQGGTDVGDGTSVIVDLVTTAPVTIAEPITLRGIGGPLVVGALLVKKGLVTYTGQIALGSVDTFISVETGQTLTATLPLTNAQNVGVAPGLIKRGDGLFNLASIPTYTGKTVVAEGTLVVPGLPPGSTVRAETSGHLAGTGTIGAFSASNGTLEPGGIGTSATGTFTMSSLDINILSTYAYQATGPQANAQDRLVVNGAVTLGYAALSPAITFTPPLGTVLTLIQKNSAGPVSGTFKNLPEGASVTVNGQTFKISYVGGDGNDVTLTRGGGTAQCTVRPNVIVQTAKDGPGRLKVTVTAGTQGFPDNRLAALHFHPGSNSLVDFNGQVGITGDVRIPLANQPLSTTFVVRRVTAGQATTLPFTAEDGCSSWKSFVGGGPAAF